MAEVSLCDGKYKFIMDEKTQRLTCKRHGETWPAMDETLLGCKALHALFHEVIRLRELQQLTAELITKERKGG